MVERNLYDEGGADFFPLCSNCSEVIYGDAGCTNCMSLPRCDWEWWGCGPNAISHQCRLREGHEGTHVCEWCYGSAPAEHVHEWFKTSAYVCTYPPEYIWACRGCDAVSHDGGETVCPIGHGGRYVPEDEVPA